MTGSKKGLVYLVAAIILAGLSAPVVKWLVTHGGKLGISNPGAISFCNILFVGNLCAALVIVLSAGWRDIKSDLRASKAFTRLLLAGTILVGGVLAPMALFHALASTSATNLMLLTRVESVAFTILAVVVFGDSVSPMNWIGLAVILLGSVLLALLQGNGAISWGDGLALVGGVLYAIGSVMTRLVLKDLKLLTLLFVRNLGGAIVFFWIALLIYGADHFATAFAPELWVVMLAYAAVVVVVGQVTWLRALKTVPVGTVAIFSTLTPVVGIFFAYTLLAEVPDGTQWLGSTIILTGVIISQVAGKSRETGPKMIVDRCLTGA